jgi:hypothetical protein
MTLIKKCDVKMYLSLRRRTRLHLAQRTEKSAVILLSETAKSIESNAPVFADDFSFEHSSRGGTVSSVVIAPCADDIRIPKTRSTSRL